MFLSRLGDFRLPTEGKDRITTETTISLERSSHIISTNFRNY